jgi:hypothetical protein
MRPLFDELGPKSPIHPALLAADSKLKLKVVAETPPKRALAIKEEEMQQKPTTPRQFVQDEVASDVSGLEFLVREAEGRIYVLACKKEGPTIRVRFSGLPGEIRGNGAGTVIFEEPRKVDVENGSFTDWFGPSEVHVYQFKKS